MRFIYIDSQGNEVNIPSVDALRLRIELGAIVDTTQFHDAGTGRWAPASEHEIYRTLKRELAGQESEGFVAPPPPGVEKPEEDVPDPEAAESRPSGGSEPEEEDGTELLDLGVDFGLVPEELPTVQEPDEAVAEAPGEEGAGEAVAGEEVDGEDGEGEGEERRPEAAEEDSFLATPMDELMGEGAAAGEEPDSPWPGDPHGMELEQSLSDSWEQGQPPEGGDSASREEEALHAAPGEEESFHGWGGEGEGEEALAEDEEPVPREVRMPVPPPSSPRPRNAPPSRKLTRARTPGAERIALVVLLVLLVGAGGWYGWQYVSTTFMGFGGEPEVELPEIPDELLPRVRQLAARASEEMARGIAELPEREVIPAEPSDDWLAGVYLARASEYPGVQEYWESVRNFVIVARAADLPLFREAFRREVEEANLTADNAALIRNRGIAGFMAAAPDRRTVFNELEAVAEAALALHTFLLANEEDISFEPATGGVSRDPVLEAVPASPELGEAMWERVGAITNALDALGYLDQIDTERLLGAFLEKLEATGIR